MQEIWKDIKGFEGLYQISNLGNIKSMSRIIKRKKYGTFRTKEKILKNAKCGKYYSITLCKNNTIQQKYIHRIVAENFINNPNNYTDVNHKDGNPHNNNINNLEWCTRSENIKHSYEVLKRKSNTDGFIAYRKEHKRKINQYDLDNNFIKQWDCISEAEKTFNKKTGGKICQCCKNKRKSAYGYKWEYVDNNQKGE